MIWFGSRFLPLACTINLAIFYKSTFWQKQVTFQNEQLAASSYCCWHCSPHARMGVLSPKSLPSIGAEDLGVSISVRTTSTNKEISTGKYLSPSTLADLLWLADYQFLQWPQDSSCCNKNEMKKFAFFSLRWYVNYISCDNINVKHFKQWNTAG